MASGSARGRPRQIDPKQIRDAALSLFMARGFDAVSATEIAEAVGISRSSVARFYPTKQQIVWEGQDQIAERLAQRLAASSEGTIVERVSVAIEQAVDYPPDELEVLRRRLRLVYDNPQLQVKRAFGRDPVAAVLAAFIRAESARALSSDDLSILSSLVADALDVALLLWGRGDSPSPRDEIRSALKFLVFE